MKKYEALIFDLDDTLLDTTHIITNPSFMYAFERMIKAGLQSNIVDCFNERKLTLLSLKRDEFINHLVNKFGARGSDEECVSLGQKAFEEKMLEVEIFIKAQTLKTLQDLYIKYPLFLVTSGSKSTQKRKVELLGIEHLFKQCFYVEPRKNEKKREAFYKILETLQVSANKILSVGNRLDLEITESKELGFWTCHVLQGEYNHIRPSNSFEVPDYTINEIQEITEICQL